VGQQRQISFLEIYLFYQQKVYIIALHKCYMTEYHCEACRFRFESARRPNACPYCGRLGTAKEEAMAAQLLDDVSVVDPDKEARERRRGQ
jgi:rubrerythrin